MSREKIEKIMEELEGLRELLKDREAALPAHSIRPHQLILIEELEEKIAQKEEELRKIQEGEGI